MEVHFTAETEKKIKELAAQSGQATDDVLEDVVTGYFDAVRRVRDSLDSRYDDLESGRVTPIDGDQFFESLRRREDELLQQRSPK
jgi:hypothetical protein